MPTTESQGALRSCIASESASRQRVHGGGGHGAAAAPAAQREIGHAKSGGDERVLGFRRADEADREGEDRSEEHTSELQSLMRISYAVFCLKKKKYASCQAH